MKEEPPESLSFHHRSGAHLSSQLTDGLFSLMLCAKNLTENYALPLGFIHENPRPEREETTPTL